MSYTRYEVNNSPVSFLKIDSGISATAARTINRRLHNKAFEYADLYFSCASGSVPTDYSFDVSNVFITSHIISICVSGSYYCGNASIEDWTDAFNFEAVTGKQLRLNDVLYFKGTSSTTPDELFLTDQYTNKLVDLLSGLYPAQMVSPKDEEGCDFRDNSVWQYGSWYFTPSGIFLKPWFRHFQMECSEENWSVILYKTVAKFNNPGVHLVLPPQ